MNWLNKPTDIENKALTLLKVGAFAFKIPYSI